MVLALVTALGLTQFVMENQVLPNRTRPKVSVQAELSEVWHSRNHIRVRGVVTWKNEGLAEVKMPAAFAVVTATGRLAGPTTALDFSDVASTLTPTVADARPYEHAPTSPRGSGIIWFDDLTPVTSLLPPGTGTQRTFLLTVDRRKVRQLDLTVSTTLLTSARFGVPETCDQAYDANDPNFLEQARKPWTGGGWTYSCVRVPFSGRNLVRTLTDDDSALIVGYAFAAPQPEFVGPLNFYESGDQDLADVDKLYAAGDRIEARNPSLVLRTNDVLPVPRRAAERRTATAPDDQAPPRS